MKEVPDRRSCVLLLREDSRAIMLYNKVALPVSWRLHGIEDLGDEFSVPQSDGIIAVGSSFPLSLHFKARRPLHVRKILRLEVKPARLLKCLSIDLELH